MSTLYDKVNEYIETYKREIQLMAMKIKDPSIDIESQWPSPSSIELWSDGILSCGEEFIKLEQNFTYEGKGTGLCL